jgi:hypothetical protein
MTPFLAVAGTLKSWTPLYLMIAGFVAIVALLDLAGTAADPERPLAVRFLLRVSAGLERVTRIPGWAAATVGTALFALLVAGVGFYNDVAWHVYTGRDKQLFTAPHTMIITGLMLIGASALLGIVLATLSEVDTALRCGRLRVPWSTVPLLVLGVTAVSGFPLDDLWHLRYGIDVTMWSPTHLLMILGASFSPIAAWLALAEAGVRPNDGRWPRVVHTLVAVLVLEGLCSVQGEFRFGVPQYQQLYHPVLICMASAFALTAARFVLGRGHALLVSVLAFASTATAGASKVRGPGFVLPRPTALFITAAIAVELVAWLLGTERRTRFALASAGGVATLGLAGEWALNVHAIQPWHRSLLVSAVVVGGLAAAGAAVLGLAFAGSVSRQPSGLPRALRWAAVVAVLVALAIPLPRRTGHVQAQITLQPASGGRAVVTAVLDPPNAADHARWFQALSWQGGGLVVATMRSTGGGKWVSAEPVPVYGKWKTLLRLHRGDQLMAVPIWLPADPPIHAPSVPAVDRTTSFANEQRYLLREQRGGKDWFAVLVDVVLAGVAVLWAWSFAAAATKIRVARVALCEHPSRLPRPSGAETSRRPKSWTSA